MVIVTTLFVVGGNVEKLICESLANRQLFKVLTLFCLLFSAGDFIIFTFYLSRKMANTAFLNCVCVSVDH